MKLSEPIGNSVWGAFLVRLGVGSFFVLKGLHELDKVPLRLRPVGALASFPDHVTLLLSLLIPYLEIGAGFLIFIGFWTVLGAIVASVVGLFFVYLTGTFSSSDDRLLNPLVVILAATLSLMYTGSGPFSIDKFRKGS